ncbi:MAG: metallophosphoesterase family protein [Thermoplasmata archaeon]
MVKFVHMADIHLRMIEKKDQDLLIKSLVETFDRTIDYILNNNIDFVVIAGDIFDSPIPTTQTKIYFARNMIRLKEKGIPVYYIRGSHDGSRVIPGDIKLFETFGVITHICQYEDEANTVLKPVTDPKTGVKLYGIDGESAGMDVEKYNKLKMDRLESNSIFVFHNGINQMEKLQQYMDVSLLPPGALYYAGGHIHKTMQQNIDGKNIYFPGALCLGYGWDDLENYIHGHGGGFYVVTLDNTVHVEYNNKFRPFEGYILDISADNRTSEEVIKEIKSIEPVNNKVLLVKVSGVLSSGKKIDINTVELQKMLKSKGALHVLINIKSLTTKEYTNINVTGTSKEEIENNVINENKEKIEEPWIPEELKGVNNFKTLLTELEVEKGDQIESQFIDELVSNYKNKYLKEGKQ